MNTLKVAARVHTRYGPISVGGVTFYNVAGERRCGRVKFLYSADGRSAVAVDHWERAPIVDIAIGTDVVRYKINDIAEVHPIECLISSVIHSVADDFCTVLVPPLFR